MTLRKWFVFGAALMMTASVLTGAAVYADESGASQINSDPINETVTDEKITLSLMSEPSTLWGAGTGKLENEDVYISSALFDTLVVLDQEAWEVKPSLATEWEWVDDTHCRFTLRDDVQMTDESLMTADDVVYSVNVWMEQSASTDTGRYLAGAVADDEHTVTIEFNVEAPDMLIMMAWPQFGIVSEDEVNALGGYNEAGMKPVMGSGKYRFVEWKTGEKILLERNENYWNPDYKGYFKEIEIHFISDGAARAMAVQSGDVDVAYDVPLMTADAAAGSAKEYLYSSGQLAHLWFNMGENAGPTKDIKVRQAIDKALDYQAISSVATAGHDVTQQLGYAGTDSPYYNPVWTEEEKAVDIEGAKALLEEAGYADGLELTITGLNNYSDVYTVMQANLAQIGIKLNIDMPDTASFVEKAFGGDYDIIIVGELLKARAPSVFPFIVRANIEGPGIVIGGPKWTTDELDSMVSEFIAAKDVDSAKDIITKIDTSLKEECVCTHLFIEPKAAICNNDIKGFRTRDERAYADLTTFYK